MRIHSAVLALGLAVAPATSYAISDSARLTALEQQLSVLQRELSNFEAHAQQAPEAKSDGAAVRRSADPTATIDPLSWALADSALGIDAGVVNDGTTYVIDRAWLGAELTLFRLPGRAPIFAPSPAGVIVRGVKPKSLAAKLGLQNGDTIVAINEKPVHAMADISAALHASSGTAKVKILRKKTDLELGYSLK